MKPEQPAARSKAAASRAPRLSWMMQAVAGIGMSGVTVAQITRSTSRPGMPAAARASSAARVAKLDMYSCFSAMRRSEIPVRVVIHSFEVSTILSRSVLVSTLAGREEPVPRITARRPGWPMSVPRTQRGGVFHGRARLAHGQARDLVVDAIVDAVLQEVDRDAHRVLDGPGRRSAMADDGGSTDAEQGHASVFGVVHLLPEAAKGGAGEQVAEPGAPGLA